jgi:hypothetical protein
MTPAELLARPVEDVEVNLSILVGCYYNFVPEATADMNEFVCPEDDRVEIRVFKHFNFDYRRFWRLAAVYLDGEPVMITQNAGREGDDHAHRYILDEERYRELVGLIASMPRKPNDHIVHQKDQDRTSVVKMDEQLGDKLEKFYGDELDGLHGRVLLRSYY